MKTPTSHIQNPETAHPGLELGRLVLLWCLELGRLELHPPGSASPKRMRKQLADAMSSLFCVMRNVLQQMNQFCLGFLIFHLVAGVSEAGGFVRREGGINPAGIFFIEIGADLQNLAFEFRDIQDDKDPIMNEPFDLGGVNFSAKPPEVNSESFF